MGVVGFTLSVEAFPRLARRPRPEKSRLLQDGKPLGSNWMPNELELILMVVSPDVDPDLSGNFSFTVSVGSLDLIRDHRYGA